MMIFVGTPMIGALIGALIGGKDRRLCGSGAARWIGTMPVFLIGTSPIRLTVYIYLFLFSFSFFSFHVF
jgi:hypothetical protein